MLTLTHKGLGAIDTPRGQQDVAYVLTVTRTAIAEDGYGHVQSKHVDFGDLLSIGQPLNLQTEGGSNVKIVLTSAAGERAVFSTADAVPSSLFVKS